MKKTEVNTFEEGLARAQALVESMESGSLPLDKTFEAYEQAAMLVKSLNAMLDLGEKKIEMLTGGEAVEIDEDV